MANKPHHHAENLEKYLTGQLSDEEMHRLEAQTLGDDFLADALDGLQMLDEQERKASFQEIKAKINEKASKKNRKKLRIILQKQRWAASLVLLIACSAILVLYKIDLFDVSFTPIAEKSEDAIQNVGENMPKISEIDTHFFDEKLTLQQPEMPEEEVRQTAVISRSSSSNFDHQKRVLEERKTKAQENAQIVDEMPIKKSNEILYYPENQIANSDFMFADTLENRPLQVPNFLDNKSPEKEAKKDLSQVDIKEGEQPLKSKLDTLEDDQNFGADHADSEEEIISESLRKNARIREAQEVHISFEKYLKTNLIYPEEARKNTISGVVKIQFAIKKNGKITGVKVLEKLGFGCDAEAMRLVRNYPHWQAQIQDGTQAQKTIEITFPLPQN